MKCQHCPQCPKVRTSPLLRGKKGLTFDVLMTLKQACPSGYQEAQDAFKDSMIHGILQFTLRIAFRCVLHRCESQEIHCWKLFLSDIAISMYIQNLVCVAKNKNIESSPSGRPLPSVHKGVRRKFVRVWKSAHCFFKKKKPATSPSNFSNDPSAGSPTETLLRLLLPLNDQVWSASQR